MNSRDRCLILSVILAVFTGACVSKSAVTIPSSESLISSGNIHYDNKRWAEAGASYFQFLQYYKKHPASESVSFKYGYVLLFQATELEHRIKAAQHFRSFQAAYPRSDNAAAALYWAASAYLMANDGRQSYRYFKRVIREYPETKWAKYAAGRLIMKGCDFRSPEQ